MRSGVDQLGILVGWPWLALVPAALLLLAYRATRRRVVLVAAVTWALYACYETGMRLRWLCSGECNIRVDLLLLYPALALLTLTAVVAALRARKDGRPVGGAASVVAAEAKDATDYTD